MVRAPLAAAVVFAVVVGAAGAADDYRNPTVGRDLALQIPGMHLAAVKRDLVDARRNVRNRDARSRAILRQAVAFARAEL
jgi:hypothetical protein